MLRIDETVEMEFKDEEGKKAWGKMVEAANSKNPYSYGVMQYARRWAKYMQKFIDEGKPVDEIADKASLDCSEGITAFMHECAVTALAQCWKY